MSLSFRPNIELVASIVGTILIVVLAAVAVVYVSKTRALRYDLEHAEAVNAQLVDDLEANRAAVVALSASYKEVYSKYAERKAGVVERRTTEILIARPTDAAKQIKDDLNNVFIEIEQEANR